MVHGLPGRRCSRDWPRIRMEIYVNLRVSMEIDGFQGYPWVSIGILGFLWLCGDFNTYQSQSTILWMRFHLNQLELMDITRDPWTLGVGRFQRFHRFKGLQVASSWTLNSCTRALCKAYPKIEFRTGWRIPTGIEVPARMFR